MFDEISKTKYVMTMEPKKVPKLVVKIDIEDSMLEKLFQDTQKRNVDKNFEFPSRMQPNIFLERSQKVPQLKQLGLCQSK